MSTGRTSPAPLRLYPGDAPPAAPADPAEWRTVDVPDLTAAERLLDHLEAQGVAERELVLKGETFQVRWR
jgi:hypothetical protein